MALENNIPVIVSSTFPYKRIRVFPDRDLRASHLELIMIDTRIMQRLRNTKQLGNSNVSYPTAEHSRFSHSLGVLYWVSKILSSLKDNHNKESNVPIIKEMNENLKTFFKKKLSHIPKTVFDNDMYLGLSWFEQLVRLYGLLHDISHIPFGHTIEDQAQLFERHDDDYPRLQYVFNMLREEIKTSYHLEEAHNSSYLLEIAIEYINLIEAMFVVGCITSDSDANDPKRAAWIIEWEKLDSLTHRPLLLAYDIVSNTICADLMDYTLRDTLFSSMPKTFDKALLTCMKIVSHNTIFFLTEKQEKNMYRLGVNISRKKVRHDIITAILDLLRIRYDLTEKVYYHHTKVIIDAMLEKVLRSLPKDNLFSPIEIYQKYLGDEGFLSLLEMKLKSTAGLECISEILNKIFRRNLYKAAFRINKNEPLSRVGKSNQNKCKKPDGRDLLERELISELKDNFNADIAEGDIIISYPPEKMQKKVAKALIEWSDGQIFTFEKLPLEANYSNEVGILTERYQSLWSMTIFINPNKIHYIKLVEAICERKFDIHNESVLKAYLKEKYKLYYETEGLVDSINNKVIALEAEYLVSEAAKGKFEKTEHTEVVEDLFEQVISSSKKARKSKAPRNNGKVSTVDKNEELQFNNK